MDPRREKPTDAPLGTADAAARIAITYAIFAAVWILFSDKVVGYLFSDPAQIVLVSTLKGWLFVAVTSLLLYYLARRLTARIHDSDLQERKVRSEKVRLTGLLTGLVEGSSDVIFAKDLRGRYLLFNREAGRVVGKAPESIVGLDDSALFPRPQAERVRANDARVIAENTLTTFEEILPTVDGERVFLTTKGPLRDDAGQVTGVFGIARDITQRKRAEEALRKSEANFRSLFEDNTSVMLLIDPESGEIVDANAAAAEFYGLAKDALRKMHIQEINALPAEEVARERQKAVRGERKVFNFPHRLASGEIRDVEVHTTPINRDGRTLLLSIIHDITQRKRAEEALRDNEERLRLALSASNQGWFDVDLRSGRITVSPEYARMIGYAPEEFQSDLRQWLDNIHEEDRDSVFNALQTCVDDGAPCSIEYRRRTKGGSWRWIRSIGKIMAWDAQRKATRLIGIHTDITERKEMEDQIRQLAFFDPLTRLPNRRLLNDRLSRAMATSKRSGRYCAAMFTDLDNFKPLNDQYGHEVGDLLLIEVADRLRNCVREMDTVARFGGDEFVVMICELDTGREESAAQAGLVAEKIRLALARPYVLSVESEDGTTRIVEHHCSASIGVTLFLNHESTQAEILKEADNAMYAAKEAGRNVVRFFQPECGEPRSSGGNLPPIRTD